MSDDLSQHGFLYHVLYLSLAIVTFFVITYATLFEVLPSDGPLWESILMMVFWYVVTVFTVAEAGDALLVLHEELELDREDVYIHQTIEVSEVDDSDSQGR